MIDALNLISRCRGIEKAKSELSEGNNEWFKKALRELSDANINPVTIPLGWNVKFIPCLMNAYYHKLSLEQAKQDSELIGQEIVDDYFAHRKKRKKR